LNPDDIDLNEQQAINESRRTRVLLENLLAERTDILVTRLVADYRNRSLDHDTMVGCVAEIAGMQEQIDKLTRNIRGAG
jgi:hypothetical protein